jgi:hypothetical protein
VNIRPGIAGRDEQSAAAGEAALLLKAVRERGLKGAHAFAFRSQCEKTKHNRKMSCSPMRVGAGQVIIVE